jgi:hypothetical protein
VPDDLIREREAASILDVSQQRVNQLPAEGKLSAVDVSEKRSARISIGRQRGACRPSLRCSIAVV